MGSAGRDGAPHEVDEGGYKALAVVGVDRIPGEDAHPVAVVVRGEGELEHDQEVVQVEGEGSGVEFLPDGARSLGRRDGTLIQGCSYRFESIGQPSRKRGQALGGGVQIDLGEFGVLPGLVARGVEEAGKETNYAFSASLI